MALFKDDYKPMGDILEEYVKALGLTAKINERKLIDIYPQVVGPTFSKYTTKIELERGILFLFISSPLVRNELMMVRNKLVTSLNNAVGEAVVKEIVLR